MMLGHIILLRTSLSSKILYDKLLEYNKLQGEPMKNYEIERKYLIKTLPENLETYPHKELEQGYLSTGPVVRIRKEDEEYYLTYKGKGLMVREEYNLPLTKESYYHLRKKIDGVAIKKTRYYIPITATLTAELDLFHDHYEGLTLLEVEFSSIEEANQFTPLPWFGEDVTSTPLYHNSILSKGKF